MKWTRKYAIRTAVSVLLALCALRINAAAFQAQNDLYRVLEGVCLNYINATANDGIDSLGIPVLQVVAPAANGQVTVNGSYFSYCPNPAFTGTDNFQYSVTVAGETHNATVYINVLPSNSFIFPGDADQNGIVQHYDLLNIGLAAGLTGPARLDSTAVNALAWQPSSYLNNDPGAADCNGDGIVDLQDLSIIATNYDDSVGIFPVKPVDTSTCSAFAVPLYLKSLNGDSLQDGDTLVVDLYLGDSSIVSDAYGMALTLQLDNGFFNTDGADIQMANSWLLQGTAGYRMYTKKEASATVEIALSRNNHNHAEGGGPALRARLPIDDNIDGIIHAPGWYNLVIGIAGVKVVNEYGVVRDVCVEQPQLMVYKNVTGIKDPTYNRMVVYPNPTNNQFTVSGEGIRQIDITDLTGRVVWQMQTPPVNTYKIALSEAGLAAGTYMLYVTGNEGKEVHKLILQP